MFGKIRYQVLFSYDFIFLPSRLLNSSLSLFDPKGNKLCEKKFAVVRYGVVFAWDCDRIRTGSELFDFIIEHSVRLKEILLCCAKIGAYPSADHLVRCQIVLFGINDTCFPVNYHLPLSILFMQTTCYWYTVCVHILPPVINRQNTYFIHISIILL